VRDPDALLRERSSTRWLKHADGATARLNVGCGRFVYPVAEISVFRSSCISLVHGPPKNSSPQKSAL
jgi:hypothetical protein